MSIEQFYMLIECLTALIGLIGTGVGAFFAIKSFIAKNKTKSASELWSMVMSMADAAMTTAEKYATEHPEMTGTQKKEMVIESVKASATAAGLDISSFLDQLSAYIDQSISFVNTFVK